MGDMNRLKEVNKMKYLAVGLLTLIIFAAGVFLGNHFSNQKVEELQDIQQNIQLQTMGSEIQYQILSLDPCQFINSTPLTKDLYELSEKLDYLEGVYGEDDERVLQMKERYSLLEVRHWLYTKRTNQECDRNNTPIMYFYSNEGNCPKCEEQGYVLTYLRKKNEDLRVYSFDINLDNPALNTIKEIYDVRDAPTLIVGSRVFREFKTRGEMEEHLGME